MENFRIKAVPGDGTCTLILTGEADLAVAPDVVELGRMSLVEADITALIIDLGAVTFMDSTAIGALVELENLADESSKKLVLVNMPARVLRVMQIAGLDTVFEIESHARPGADGADGADVSAADVGAGDPSA